MNYQTELMQKILTNKKAQEIIDYVSQIYGNSYVGLWLFQAIGSVLGPVCDLSAQLRNETNPNTTTVLLPYWEQEYGIEGDPTMTLAQRRNVIIAAIRSKGPATPARLAEAVAAALGITSNQVVILENTGKNQFTVYIQTAIDPAPAIAVIDRMKPAHLTYEIMGAVQKTATPEINTGTAMTRAEMYQITASNTMTVILTPVIVDDYTLMVERRNPITGQATLEETPHTDDGAGTVTLPELRNTDDGAGTVTLISRIVTRRN